MNRRKILFVGMQHSIHVARWIELINDLGWDLHLFAIDQGAPNPNLKGVTLHMPRSSLIDQDSAPNNRVGDLSIKQLLFGIRDYFKSRQVKIINGDDKLINTEYGLNIREFQAVDSGVSVSIGADRKSNPFHSPDTLNSVIDAVQPDIIHSMEFQHCGYLTLTAKELRRAGSFPPWIATNWGSDIFLFGREPDHEKRIRELLQSIDLYSCECKRDVDLAYDFGFRGHALPVLTNTGGFDMNHIAKILSTQPPSKRKILMIKGYHHFAGRAMTSIRVLEHFASKLKDYEVVLYSCSEAPRTRALELKSLGILNIRVIDWATHDEILYLFSRARLYMGISISDAISTSVLESMVMGAFPIQTDTSCCDEWFRDGESGFIVRHDDFDQICDRFHRALTDDDLVDRAAEINYRTIKARLDLKILKSRAEVFCDEAFNYISGNLNMRDAL